MKVEGFEELQRTLRRFGSQGELARAVRPKMNRLGAKILRRSIALTPRDRGALVNSGSHEVINGGLGVVVGYSAPFAYFVHENPRAGKTGGVSPSGRRYKHWASVGEYQFLRKAMDEARGYAWRDIGEGIEGWLRRHGR